MAFSTIFRDMQGQRVLVLRSMVKIRIHGVENLAVYTFRISILSRIEK